MAAPAQQAAPGLRHPTCQPAPLPPAARARPSFPWSVSAGRRHAVLARAEQEQAGAQLDVSGVVVDTAFRSTPWREEAAAAEDTGTAARLLFVSESNVCRSVLAEAFFREAAQKAGLAGAVEVQTRGTRNYNEGEGPDPLAAEYAEGEGLALRVGHAAAVFSPARDIVQSDLVLVMDKFTAADVLREVSVYDTINAAGGYARKVRRLGEFHPGLAGAAEPEGQDLDDPLYGNLRTPEDRAAVARCGALLREACEGLAAYLLQVHREAGEGAPLRAALGEAVQKLQATSWLVPPMLSRAGAEDELISI